MLKTISAVAAVTAASMLVVPTVSQASVSRSARVSYADLNLASPVGAQILERRIAGAAKFVCEIEDSRELALANATNSCRSDAIAGAQPQYEAAVAAARHGSVTVLDGASLIVTAL
jgi:UrcA family protein